VRYAAARYNAHSIVGGRNLSQTARGKVIVGMPAFNEAKYIGSLVLQILPYADEVVVLDDGSKDRTAEIAEKAGARVVRHATNMGYGSAIRALLREGLQQDADVLVILDADAQHDPSEIPVLVSAIREGSDLVIGSRAEQQHRIPAYRRFGQRVIGGFTRLVSGSSVGDTESGFRAYSRHALETLKLKESGMAVSAEIVSAASAQGLKVREVPITVSYDTDSSTLNPVRHGLGVLSRVLVMISERRPLLAFGSLGLATILAGIILGVVVIRVLQLQQVLQMGSAMISMLLITVGMMSITTGLVLNVFAHRLDATRVRLTPQGRIGRLVYWLGGNGTMMVFSVIGMLSVALSLYFGLLVIQVLQEQQVLQVGSALVSLMFAIAGVLTIYTGLILSVVAGRLSDL
jgi:glycosyltransferase involved in cell wall biosynthesis